MTKRIPLSQGKHWAIVDDEDYPLVARYVWTAHKIRYCLYATRKTTRRGGAKSEIVYMHRMIMRARPGQQADHVDRNGLNNTRANLRICEPTQNRANQKRRKDAISQYKGVTPQNKQRTIWTARIRHKGAVRRLHGFRSEVEAARAYDAMARETFGEFARLNFPDE